MAAANVVMDVSSDTEIMQQMEATKVHLTRIIALFSLILWILNYGI
jgi:hypothetical protein